MRTLTKLTVMVFAVSIIDCTSQEIAMVKRSLLLVVIDRFRSIKFFVSIFYGSLAVAIIIIIEMHGKTQ